MPAGGMDQADAGRVPGAAWIRLCFTDLTSAASSWFVLRHALTVDRSLGMRPQSGRAVARARRVGAVNLAIIYLEPSLAYGTIWIVSTAQLTSTSYLVLGLLAREGPSTPYALKRHVAATLGHFWSFPHSLLYGEPARLAGLGLLREEREQAGRRRRVFAITEPGQVALAAWLARPSREPTELRDPGLLQLFFADLGPPEARAAIAEEQLAIHRAKLVDYEADQRAERGTGAGGPGGRTTERWRGETVQMGLLYERAAVAFWAGIVESANRASGGAPRAQAPVDGAHVSR